LLLFFDNDGKLFFSESTESPAEKKNKFTFPELTESPIEKNKIHLVEINRIPN
jgi:hypothetical protein